MIKASYLDGQLLLAMPGMTDPRFDRSVIYMCNHNEEGAMGLVINSAAVNIDFPGLLKQLDVPYDSEKFSNKSFSSEHTKEEILIHSGGPVEVGRGFILHTADYMQDSTMIISETIALTATVDILAAIAQDEGPNNFIIALGYTGWGQGQLEEEINHNSWLHIEPDEELLFRTDLDLKWPRAMAKLGVDITMLSTHSGNA
ncbi:MAG: YqgE/AlgH family protein [Emcibacter sp.]|nr:YqgE/AlgH family protein [Emcibacter sp.]